MHDVSLLSYLSSDPGLWREFSPTVAASALPYPLAEIPVQAWKNAIIAMCTSTYNLAPKAVSAYENCTNSIRTCADT
ncbi:BZ3500_MvSof-1268-A1-R1_Chr10-4g03095 [Microbotryum saponariae]|uniref:BZ3500_MvSof-1268-A1-R1_Chr10-4g03095 protein n=1 Tax=Microbotryum saponariae TaxID=289078 RepID=A0A2X0L6E4_9BASI|nr:BZ3501_MvSof-1269-A2-R1_Chr10-2g02670 [Microbotryum saponariae]SDA01139.1 BZ3500_MvSof-1268-A1-R1_Chr10-4g03095 [Microbotryum saponariae]